MPCRVRRLFGSSCHLCHNLSSSSPEADIGEEETISSNPTTIDVALESGLIGMITIKDILNQLVCPRKTNELNEKSVSFPQSVGFKATQN